MNALCEKVRGFKTLLWLQGVPEDSVCVLPSQAEEEVPAPATLQAVTGTTIH